MRILIYTHEYPPVKAGAGNYVFELAKELARLQHEVAVVAPAYSENGGVETGGPVTVYRMRDWETSPPWCYRFFLKAYLKHRPDMVVVADRDAQEMVARMPRRFFRYCTVLYGTEVWAYFDSERSQLRPGERRLFERFFLSAESILSISRATGRLLESYLPETRPLISIVGAGIDPAAFPPASRERVEQLRESLALESHNVLLCLARMDADKGHDALLEAFAKVLEEVPDTVLLLVGQGPTRQQVEDLAREIGVDRKTRFLGSVRDEERCSFYALCDVYVMPSRCTLRWEGFGLVFLEANSYGKPVVAGAVGGVPEAVEDGVSGILVDPLDRRAIADAIVRLLKDRSLRAELGKKGRERLLAEYTSDKVALRAISAIEDRMASPRCFRGTRGRIVQAANLAYWRVYCGMVGLLVCLRWIRYSSAFRAAGRRFPAGLRRRVRAILELPLHGRRRGGDTADGSDMKPHRDRKCS